MSERRKLPDLPQADDVYHIYWMRFGTLERRVKDNFLATDLHDGPMALDYGLWVLANQARTVLLDTGYGREAANRRDRPMEFDPVEGLERIGIDANAIEDIVISHLHYDHAGNIGRFPRARFHVQDAEVSFATGRCMCDRFLRTVFDVDDVIELVRHVYADRVVFHDGDDDLLPGLRLVALPGHSGMVQGIVAQTTRGPVFLVSDAAHFYANLVRREPFVLTLDAAATLQSYKRIMKIAGNIDRVVPGHDPLVRAIYPGCEVNGITLSALHEAPAALPVLDGT